ncbi:MAG: hypothetical protein ACRC2N_14220 [Aeromonas sp.]
MGQWSNYKSLGRAGIEIKPLIFFSFFKAKIAALKAEITLLKDECDFLNKRIEKMKSAVPSAKSQINIPAVPRLSGLFHASFIIFVISCYLNNNMFDLQ